ncbi:MAG TPA: hypothetical protein VFO34_02610 [Candidatus Acidoferrales bacterium]|nr:hypothetical protein [Candidatus Acidoferrales bacterium]
MTLNGETAILHSLGDVLPANRATIANIFKKHDLEFVGKAAPELRDAFLRERKRLALLWILQTRRRATRLMQIHRMAVREHPELQVEMELKLAASYWQLLCLCGLLQLVISARGPFETQRMTRFVTESASEFWAASDRILTGLKGGLPRREWRYLNQ